MSAQLATSPSVSRRRVGRPLALGVVTALIAAGLAVLTPALSASAVSSTVTATVYAGASASAAENVYVQLYDVTNASYPQSGDADYASASGKVTLGGLVSGHKYVLEAQVRNWNELPDYATTYLGSFTHYTLEGAGYFTPGSSNTKAIHLKTGYTISGVINRPDGEPASGVGGHHVVAYEATGEVFDGFANYNYIDDTYSLDSDASYSIGSFPSGDFILQYVPANGNGWGQVYSGGVTSIGDANAVTTGPVSPVVNAQFVDGATISGTVTANGGAIAAVDPAIDVSVTVSAVTDSEYVTVGQTVVDAVGNYSVDVAPGDYAVSFSVHNGDGTVFGEYYDNQPTYENATTVTVAQGDTGTANADLGSGFTVSGTLTQDGVGALNDYDVELQSFVGADAQTRNTTTGVDGSYSFSNVAPGGYRIFLSDPEGTNPDLYVTSTGFTEYWNSAEKFYAVDGAIIVDKNLPAYASVDVTLTSSSGAAINGASLYFYPVKDGVVSYGAGSSYAYPTGVAGVYRASRLDPSFDYTVYVQSSAKGTYNQYYGGGVSEDEAASFSIDQGENSLDFSMATATGASGKVLSSSKRAIKGAFVYAEYFDGTEWVWVDSFAKTSSSGAWSMPTLRAGSYKFIAYGPDGSSYYTGYSGGASDEESAKAYYIPTGTMTSVNFTLRTGGTISGKLIGEADLPLGGGSAYAVALVGDPVHGFTDVDTTAVGGYSSISSSTGKFVMRGVPAGYYAIAYYPSISFPVTFPSSYIGGTSALTASVVKVTSGKTTTVPTWTTPFSPGLGTISGHITAPGGGELDSPYYYVTVQSTTDTEAGRYQQLGIDGQYSFEGLPVGDYYVGINTNTYSDADPTYMSKAFIQTASAIDTPVDVELDAYEHLAFVAAPSVVSPSGVKVGAKQSVVPGVTNFSSDASYQWYRQPEGPDTRAIIRGATNASYVPAPSDYDSALFVRVTYRSSIDAPNPIAEDSVTQMLGLGTVGFGDQPLGESAPILTPTGVVATGTVLHSTTGRWWTDLGSAYAPSTTYQYLWYVNGVQDVSAFQSSYTVTAEQAEAGALIDVGVIGTRPNTASSAMLMSNVVSAVKAAAPYAKTSPKVTKVGAQTYKVSNGTWSLSGLTYSYEWFIDGVSVGIPSDEASIDYSGPGSVTVTVYAERPGYFAGAKTVLVKKATPTPPTVDVAPVVRVDDAYDVEFFDDGVNAYAELKVLDGAYTYLDGTNFVGTPKYQWQSSTNGTTWKSISKATKSTFSPSSAYLGRQLRVQVTLVSSTYGTSSFYPLAGTVKPSDKLDALGTDPTITGSAFLNRTISAQHGAYPFSSVTYKYQWMKWDGAEFQPIVGKTTTTLALSAVDYLEGDVLAVQVTAHRTGYADSVKISSGVAIGDTTIQNLTIPRISPSALGAVGTKLTASGGAWDVSSPTLTYNWYVSGHGSPVQSGSSKTFVLDGSYETNEVSLSVVATKTGYGSSVETFAANPVYVMPAAKGAAPTTVPVALGTPAKVGEEEGVSADVNDLFTYADPAHSGAKVSYQWYRSGKAISGARSASYTPTSSDVGKSLKVKMTATSAFFATASFYSDSVVVGFGSAPTGAVSISYTTAEVQPATRLTAQAAGFPSHTSVSYTWKLSKDAGATWSTISKATKSYYTVPTSYVGYLIDVEVTGKKSGYAAAVLTSGAPVEVQPTSEIAWFDTPGIAGYAAPGGTLGVYLGAANTTKVKTSYQWLINGSEIPGATGSTIKIVPAFYGHTLSVRVTGTKAGYAPGVATSNELEIQRASAPSPLSGKAPKIQIDTQTCDSYGVNYGSWTVGGMSYSVTWYAGETGDTASELSTDLSYQTGAYGNRIWASIVASSYGYESAEYQTAAFTTVDQGCAP
jgi:hypothetical protein